MKTHALIACPDHTQCVFDYKTLPAVADWAAKHLAEHKIEAIVVCGHSGLLLAGALLCFCGMPCIAVRKAGERSVADDAGKVNAVLANGPVTRWAWVDDMICTGGTYRWSRNVAYESSLITTKTPALVLSYRRGKDFIRYYETNGENTYAIYKDGEHYPIEPGHTRVKHFGWRES